MNIRKIWSVPLSKLKEKMWKRMRSKDGVWDEGRVVCKILCSEINYKHDMIMLYTNNKVKNR